MTEIRVPQLAEGVTSGTVVNILVSVGAKINPDDSIVELETEKAVAPIPAGAQGTVSTIHVKEGDSVSVGQVLVTLDGNSGEQSTQPEAGKAEAAHQEPSASSQPQGTVVDIQVPALAEGINSGTVVNVAVKEGETVSLEQTLIELETEKAVAPLPSTAAGKVVKILVKEGDSVQVGQRIVQIEASGWASQQEGGQAAPKAQAAPIAAKTTAQQLNPPPGDYKYESSAGFPPPASPTVRKMAKELGIDLTRVMGSGHGGRIVVDDLKRYIAGLQQAAAAPQSGGASGRVSPPVDFSKWGEVQVTPMTLLRKKIAEKMTESWATIPHVTQFDEADISHILKLRKKYLADYEKAGAKLTVTSFVYKAVTDILKEFPEFNSSLNEATQEIVFKNYYHIGLAVDTEQGLIVPVIRDVDKKDMAQISKDIAELAKKTRERKISLEDMQGGTFTISNQGGIGGAHFTPIINKPEAAILGVGQAQKKYKVIDDKPEIRMMMPLGLSYDHRLIDGGKAARFISAFVMKLENFDEKDVKV